MTIQGLDNRNSTIRRGALHGTPHIIFSQLSDIQYHVRFVFPVVGEGTVVTLHTAATHEVSGNNIIIQVDL